MPVDPPRLRAAQPSAAAPTTAAPRKPAVTVAAPAPTAPADGFSAVSAAAPSTDRYAPVPIELAIRESIGLRGAGVELPTADEVASLKAQGKDVVFSNLALDEAHGLPDRADQFATREAVQGVVLSIDSYQTNDLDNAMSFRREADGSMVVGIHAVDLAAWVRPGGALDFAARRRVESRYLDDQGLVLPMLPLSLCEGKLSLFEGQPRLTRSVELRYSPDGQLLDSRIFRSQLVNRFRLDEADASAAARGHKRGATDPELRDALASMAKLAAKANGSTDPHAAMAMDKMLGFFTQQSTKVVGEALQQADLEASFRNQAAPQSKSTYDSQSHGHASLAARAYAPWTGPMRRYADLDVHRALDRMLDGRAPKGRTLELDSRMRDLQLDRANHVVVDPRLDDVSELVAVTRTDGSGGDGH